MKLIIQTHLKSRQEPLSWLITPIVNQTLVDKGKVNEGSHLLDLFLKTLLQVLVTPDQFVKNLFQ